MKGRCLSCGAPLQAAGNAPVTCQYCGRINARGPQAPSTGSSVNPRLAYWMSYGLVALFMAGTWWVTQRRMAQISIPSPTTSTSASTPSSALHEAPATIRSASKLETNSPPASGEAPSSPADPQTSPGEANAVANADPNPNPNKGKPRAAKPPREPEGVLMTKADAEKSLEPEILACMKTSGTHYLITRLGSGSTRRNPVPPLRITETSIVDYRPTPNFDRTPLGKCILRAAKAVRAPTYRGNYMYFGVRNPDAVDPLEDAPSRLSHESAQATLGKYDGEARECDRRAPDEARPGERVQIEIHVQGVDGTVTRVSPIYVPPKSKYAKCLESVYRKVRFEKFREISHRVVYTLAP